MELSLRSAVLLVVSGLVSECQIKKIKKPLCGTRSLGTV
jgi:hypothetical protein